MEGPNPFLDESMAKVDAWKRFAERWQLRYPDAPRSAVTAYGNICSDIRLSEELFVYVHYVNSEDDGEVLHIMLFKDGEDPSQVQPICMCVVPVADHDFAPERGEMVINVLRVTEIEWLLAQLNPTGWFGMVDWKLDYDTFSVDPADVERVTDAMNGVFGRAAQLRVQRAPLSGKGKGRGKGHGSKNLNAFR